MATELTKIRFRRLCNAVKKVNTPEGITNAEIVEVNNTRAVVDVKEEFVSQLYNELEKVGIYPLIIKSGIPYTLSVKLSEVDHPLFVKELKMAKKKVVVEFEVDDSLTVIDLCEVVHDAMKKARWEVDEKFDRIGTGRGAALFNTTIRFIDFEDVNLVYRNGMIQRPRRRRTN